jgi:hypothetical protein
MRTTLLGSLALLGAFSLMATAPHASAYSPVRHAAKTQSLASYFPGVNQYPVGYTAVPVRTYSEPSQLFTRANADLATRYHFVAGATQAAFGHDVVVTITIARFRDQLGARRFRTAVQSDVIPDGKQKSGTVRGLGPTGGRYESGGCASCGPTAPTLSQVFFARGPIFVQLGVQPSNLGLARHIGTVIDAKLKQAHVR